LVVGKITLVLTLPALICPRLDALPEVCVSANSFSPGVNDVSKILGLCRDFDQHLCLVYTRLTYSYPNTLISNGEGVPMEAMSGMRRAASIRMNIKAGEVCALELEGQGDYTMVRLYQVIADDTPGTSSDRIASRPGEQPEAFSDWFAARSSAGPHVAGIQ
jgi:hypothetical protein